jgi:hypothetical protein
MSKRQRLLWILMVAAGCGSSTGGQGSGGMGSPLGGAGGKTMLPAEPDPTRLFPATSPWYQDVSGAALDAESGQVITGLDRAGGWGTGALRIDFSIEVLRADPSVAARPFTKNGDFYEPDCDFVPVPVPPGGRLEGERGYQCAGDGDCHLIVVQGAKLFEMWRANITGETFAGGCLAVWDLARDPWGASGGTYARGDQCSSADAAGYPIAPLLFSADEVRGGAINHAIRFILPNERIRKGQFVHPATHSGAGKGTPSPGLVPYGARLRLKADVDLGRLPSNGARVVARAMQKYGMFLADGGNIALTAQADTDSATKWEGLLGPRDLSMLKVTDFEMVDGGPRIPLTLDCRR